MAPIKFKSMSDVSFRKKYPEALENAESEDSQIDLGSMECRGFGEVKIPGTGWVGCVLGLNGQPIYFYSEDDGWLRCPAGDFESSE